MCSHKDKVDIGQFLVCVDCGRYFDKKNGMGIKPERTEDNIPSWKGRETDEGTSD